MSIGEALGVKSEKLKLSGDYSVEALYEKIKDVPFEAGQPQLVKNGFAYIIAFPELDRNNQVQINGFKGSFSVQRSPQPAGLNKMAGNMALDQLTDGLSSLSGAFGNKKKLCMELVTKTAETINALGL